MKTLLLILSLALIFFPQKNLFPAIYYVSASGNDANNGTSTSTPWQTITKVNSMMSTFNPGDQILFKRGDTFTGSLNITKSGTSGNEIIFGSYSSGNLPVITGKKPIGGWTIYSGGIYRAPCNDTVSQLYADGKLMTIARYPNTGFLKIDAGSGNTGFTDAALTQTAGYFNGANCRMRTINWKYEVRTVTNFSGGSVTFSPATIYNLAADYGYYMDNKLNLLDVAGEWYQDLPAGFIYLYFPGGAVSIEGVSFNTGALISGTINHIKIRELNITGYKNSGISNNTGTNVSIKKCNISYCGAYGILLNGSNHLIDSNTILDNFNIGISGVWTNGIASNNLIRRTGLIAGYGINDIQYLAAQIYTVSGVTFQYNTIDSNGYTGIDAGSNMVIQNNIISNTCLTLNDGAGINIGTCDGVQIKNNFISNCIGNTESSSSPVKYAHGIAFGPYQTKNVLIQGNTISSNRYDGIFADTKNPNENNQILDNILYNNFKTQITFQDYSAAGFSPTYNYIVKRNMFYCLNQLQTCMEQEMWHSTSFVDYGNFDSNFYCNPYQEVLIGRVIISPYDRKLHSLQTWKTLTGKELNSKYSNFSFEQYRVTDTLSNNLITNSRFTSNVSNWSSFPAGSTIAQVTQPLLDTGSMRMRWNGIGFVESIVRSNNVSVTKGDYLLSSFSCVGNQYGQFPAGTSISGPVGYLYEYRKYFVYQNVRRNYFNVFRVDTNDAAAKLRFGLILPDSLLYIDNVYLYKVTVQRLDSTQLSKLFTNQTAFTQNFSLGGVTYKDPDGTSVTGSISLQPYTSRILILDPNTVKSLQVNLLIEGFYNASTNLITPDSVTVYLRNFTSPYLIVDSSKSGFDSQGNCSFNYTKANNNTNYYLDVNHRNSIETWSSSGILFDTISLNSIYDFTSSLNKAYGNNMKQVDSSPVEYAVYGGDVNKDGTIDVTDIVEIYNDVINLVSGYGNTDLTGDNFVDSSDLLIAYNNSINIVSVITPP